jgi:hypothetical protein
MQNSCVGNADCRDDIGTWYRRRHDERRNLGRASTDRTIAAVCKKYEEWFDLAHLAGRAGKSSDVMVRELTVMSGRLNECLLTPDAHVQVARSDFSVALDASRQNGG